MSRECFRSAHSCRLPRRAVGRITHNLVPVSATALPTIVVKRNVEGCKWERVGRYGMTMSAAQFPVGVRHLPLRPSRFPSAGTKLACQQLLPTPHNPTSISTCATVHHHHHTTITKQKGSRKSNIKKNRLRHTGIEPGSSTSICLAICAPNFCL